MRISSRGNRRSSEVRTLRARAGWTTLEALIALTILVFAFGSVAAGAREALQTARVLEGRLSERITERNECAQRVLDLAEFE